MYQIITLLPPLPLVLDAVFIYICLNLVLYFSKGVYIIANVLISLPHLDMVSTEINWSLWKHKYIIAVLVIVT